MDTRIDTSVFGVFQLVWFSVFCGAFRYLRFAMLIARHPLLLASALQMWKAIRVLKEVMTMALRSVVVSIIFTVILYLSENNATYA